MSGQESYAIYLYADGLIQWTTSDTDGGLNGIGGKAAEVGYISTRNSERNSEIRKFLLPGSETCSIIDIPSRSNVKVPGIMVLPLDGTNPATGRPGKHTRSHIYRFKVIIII